MVLIRDMRKVFAQGLLSCSVRAHKDLSTVNPNQTSLYCALCCVVKQHTYWQAFGRRMYDALRRVGRRLQHVAAHRRRADLRV